MSQATIWNPNTAEKKVINVGDSMPTGFSLWTGGTASGQQAQAAITKTNTSTITPTPPSNKMNSSTINLGVQNSNIGSQLPNSNNLATSLYADRSLQDATTQQTELQKTLDQEKAQRITENANQLKETQASKDTAIANYDNTMDPLKEKATGIYNSMLDSISGTDYSSLTKQKLDLTNDIVNYSKMMKDELDANANSGATLQSYATETNNSIVQNYTSKIAIAQAASSAIDGNFNLAFDIMDKGANAITSLTNDRINFINTVKGLFDSKITSLTSEQSKLLDQAQTDAQTKLDNIQKNKDTIMSLMQTNPIIANKAGLSLTDTPEQITQKLNTLYQTNPQYTPDNQAWIKSAMEKYYDAGITMSDPVETVKSKITQSKIYQNDIVSNANKVIPGTLTNPTNPGVVTDPTGNAYDISSYATDPNHETAVQNLINGMGQFKSVADIDNYINSKYPNSPVTGQMIYNAAEKFGVSWEAMTAIMEQDSSLGTAGIGARTFNPGNVGNDDSGNIKNYGDWQSGVDGVAQWLSNHKTTATPSNPDIQIDPESQSILSQTGLSIPAFAYLTQGTTALTRMTSSERLNYMKEAEDWSKSKGIDIATFKSQYEAYNEALQSNIKRVNNVKVAEGELAGTLDNLGKAADDSSFNAMKWANVAKMFAGQEFNDQNVSKYAFHLNQLRSEMALYNAAAAGKGQTDDSDYAEAETIIKDGFAAGSVKGFEEALKNSVAKMDIVLNQNLDRTNKQVWDLFGVGNNYQNKTPELTNTNTVTTPESQKGFWSNVGNWLFG